MEIETSARLHLSLIDLNGLEGRLDGGIGITLDKPSLKMECKHTNHDTIVKFKENISIPNYDLYESKILEATMKMKEHFNIEKNYTFTRDCFAKKLCFDTCDLENYLETSRSYFNISESIAKDAYLYNILNEIGNMKLNEFIDNYGNTVEDLIDTSIYIYNHSKN